jgi:hypothetical protein
MGTVGGGFNYGPVHLSSNYFTFGSSNDVPATNGTVRFTGNDLQVYINGAWRDISTSTELSIPEVNTVADLPTTGVAVGDYYSVLTSTGFLWKDRKGLYRYNTDTTWTRLSNQTLTTELIDFDLTATVSGQEGRLCWNATDGTLNLGMPGGNVNLQVGQEQLIRVTNDEAVQIDNGQVVYISGATGANPKAKLAN